MDRLLVLVLVIFPGVWSGDWRVTMQSPLCALRGTTLIIQCFYDYPYWNSVRQVLWRKEVTSGRVWALTSSRFVFVGDKSHNCALKINSIDYADEGNYYFSFETNYNRWTSKSPARISVRDLIASVQPTTVTEGDFVTLTCRSGCDTQINIQPVWFREGQQVTYTRFKVRKEDAGRYICELPGLEHVQSTDVSLNVQYAPENVMLSMSPSEDIVLGRALIFSCNSDANPPVEHSGYILFKNGHIVSYGPNHVISEIQLSDGGLYYCQAANNITSTGSKLFQSSEMIVNVQYPPMNVSISVDSAEVPEGSTVNLTCHSDANPPAFGYTWYRVPSDPSSVVPVGSGSVLSLSSVEASHSGQYLCHSWNKHGGNNSTVLLSVMTKGTAVSVYILAGVGVSFLVALVLILLFYWKKQKKQPEKQITELSEKDLSSSDETVDHIYANTHMCLTYPNKDNGNFSSQEEVFYTTVSIKPRKPRRKSQTQRTEEDESVIYATVVKSN